MGNTLKGSHFLRDIASTLKEVYLEEATEANIFRTIVEGDEHE